MDDPRARRRLRWPRPMPGRYLLYLLVLGITVTIALQEGSAGVPSLFESTVWRRAENRTQATAQPAGVYDGGQGTDEGSLVDVVRVDLPADGSGKDGTPSPETLAASEWLALAGELPAGDGSKGESGNGSALAVSQPNPNPEAGSMVAAVADPDDRRRGHPTDRSGVRPSEEAVTPAAARPYDHEVVAGDTVYGLAEQLGISPDTILWANGLSEQDTLRIGDRLTILPADGVLHEVVAGDSLLSVAAVHEADADKIVTANALGNRDALALGQKLIIPGGRPSRPQPIRQALAQSAGATGPAPALSAPRSIVPPASTAPGERIVLLAAQYLGYRYLWGGHAPDTGFDCSGFVWYVYGQAGIALPLHDLWGQINAGPRVSQGQLLPGDVVFFENTYQPGLSHDGIYVGGGRFISAATEGKGVRVDRLDDPYWGPRYFAASRPWG